MIRIRIAFLFSVLTGLALLLFMSVVFITSRYHIESNFYDDLFAKAKLSAQVELEKDELTAEIYDEIIHQHMAKFSEEQEYILAISELTNTRSGALIAADEVQRILTEGQTAFMKNDRQWVGIFYPDNEGDFIVLMAARDEQGAAEMSELLENMGIALVVTMLVQFIVGYFFARSITFPLIAIGNQAKQISTSDLSSRFAVENKKDELGQVVARLNEMLDRLELGFETQRKFISNASHELKTPLTVIMGESEVALNKERSTQEYVQSLHTISHQSEKLKLILTDLIQLTEVSSAGIEYFERSAFQIEDLILEVQTELLQAGLRAERIHVVHEESAHLQDFQLFANRPWIRIALVNILSNALKFSNDRPVELTTWHIPLNDGQHVLVIRVKDEGIGIPKQDLIFVKNPFFRAKNARDIMGSGVGLSIVNQIMQLHHGSLKIQSEEGQGTTVILELPLRRINL